MIIILKKKLMIRYKDLKDISQIDVYFNTELENGHILQIKNCLWNLQIKQCQVLSWRVWEGNAITIVLPRDAEGEEWKKVSKIFFYMHFKEVMNVMNEYVWIYMIL